MRWAPATLSAIAMCGLWLACADEYGDTGGTPDAGPLVGDTGGKCFSDGTCKTGLVCLSSLCVALGDAAAINVDSGRDGSTSTRDAGTDADPNVGPDPDQTPQCDLPKPGPLPGNCESVADCSATTQCCFTVRPKAGGTCGDLVFVTAACLDECDTDQLTGCTKPADCDLDRACLPRNFGIEQTTTVVPAKVCTKPP